MTITEKDFQACYEQYGQGHGRLRDELLAALPEPAWWGSTVKVDFRAIKHRRFIRTAMAAAALIIVAVGVRFNPFVSQQVTNPHTAWATAMEQTGNLNSVHFRLSTPGSSAKSGGASVEMWWRRPHDFRLEFNNGLVMTGNDSVRCTYNKKSNNLTLMPGGQPGLEMAVLGELGQLFTSNVSLSGKWIADSKQVGEPENIMYQGEKCLKMTYVKDGKRFVYIMDAQDPLIYDARMYSGDSDKLMYHIEILKIDSEIPDAMFGIEKTDDMKVSDKRNLDVPKLPALPKAG